MVRGQRGKQAFLVHDFRFVFHFVFHDFRILAHPDEEEEESSLPGSNVISLRAMRFPKSFMKKYRSVFVQPR